MMTESELLKVAVLEYRLKWLGEALLESARDLARAGMSGYQPTSAELLQYARWLYEADEAFKQEAENIIKNNE